MNYFNRKIINYPLLIILCLLTIGKAVAEDLASSINSAAIEALKNTNLIIKDSKVLLYGVQTNGADTKKGKYACAKVVSVTLRKAGVDIPITLGVAGIETKLKHWQHITKEENLQPGDIIIWTSIFKGNKNGACTGNGTCHVGIVYCFRKGILPQQSTKP